MAKSDEKARRAAAEAALRRYLQELAPPTKPIPQDEQGDPAELPPLTLPPPATDRPPRPPLEDLSPPPEEEHYVKYPAKKRRK